MNRLTFIIISLWTFLSVDAQTLSLDSCRAMALRANKEIRMSRIKQQVAAETRKSARKKYLPHVNIVAGWELMSKEISILNDDQKGMLSHIGTATATSLGGQTAQMTQDLKGLAMSGDITPKTATTFGGMLQGVSSSLVQYGDAMGQKIVDAFRTDTRSMFAASVLLSQPIYMGGAITAANNMADIAEGMAMHQTDVSEQSVLYDIDKTYWTVVSLRHKQALADKYLALVQKLNHDVHSMIKNGVATRADGLKVDVRVNEAEMTKTQVDNGLALAKMLLCQLCGLPIESDVTLVDEKSETLANAIAMPQYDRETSIGMRPEMQLLESAIQLSEASTKLARAAYLPQVALTGGYLLSNPSVYNGFENKFGGIWNVGIMLRMPVFDWGEGLNKIRASKLATTLARMKYEETEELVNLQISQCEYRLKEANKMLATAQKNIQGAEENLRCANVGFQEGVMETTEVMAAQTAWLQAQTQHVDAEIEVRLAEAGLKKALGIRAN